MYICICKKVTDHEIRKAVLEQRVTNMRQVRACLGACDQCGKCASDVKSILRAGAGEPQMLSAHGFSAV